MSDRETINGEKCRSVAFQGTLTWGHYSNLDMHSDGDLHAQPVDIGYDAPMEQLHWDDNCIFLFLVFNGRQLVELSGMGVAP